MRSLPAGKRWAEIGVTAGVWVSALGVCGGFLWIVGDILSQGLGELSWSYLASGVRDAGRSGGVAPVLVSTALLVGVSILVAGTVGLGTGILLAEYAPISQRAGRWIRRSLDVLAGMPSIVFGLFGNAFFCSFLGLGFSILSGALTLACMVLPILIRTIEHGLRAVSQEQRLNAAALGVSRRGAIMQILLPAAMPAVLAGMVLGLGRAIAETAALIFTSGYVDRMPRSLMDSGRSLSIHIYDLAMNVPGGSTRAYGAASVLLILLVLINLGASWGLRRTGKLHNEDR